MAALKPLTQSNQNSLNNSSKQKGQDTAVTASATTTTTTTTTMTTTHTAAVESFTKLKSTKLFIGPGKSNNTSNDNKRPNTDSTPLFPPPKSPSKFNTRNPLLLRTPRVNRGHLSHTNNKTSDSTIQLDFTQVTEKSPITSTPLVNNFKNDVLVHEGESTQVEGQFTADLHTYNTISAGNATTLVASTVNQSFIEKDIFMDKIDKLINVSKKRLGEDDQLSSNKTFYAENENLLNELDLIDEEPEYAGQDKVLIKLLTDALVKVKNSSNYQKLESKLLAQNSQDLTCKIEVENKLMKKELERLKVDYSLDSSNTTIGEDLKIHNQKYGRLKKMTKNCLENLETLVDKNRELSKRALKYKVKYTTAKELIREKDGEIRALKRSQKPSPPRFKIVHPYDYQHQFDLSKQKEAQQQYSKNNNITNSSNKLQTQQNGDDTTISPDHTIITHSPTGTTSSASSNSGEILNRLLPNPLQSSNGPSSPSSSSANAGSKVKNTNNMRAFDTLNMLASQALLASTSYERSQKSRKLNNESGVPTKNSYDGFVSSEKMNRKLPMNDLTTNLPPLSNRNPATKLPGIDHLLNRPPAMNYSAPSPGFPMSVKGKASLEYKLNQENSDTESSNLNSNDTIDEDPTY